jgi:hypothetical protein
MTRTSVTFSEPQLDWLQSKAKELGITVSELVRRLVDKERGE